VGESQSGQFFADQRAVPDPFMQDAAAVEALYQLCLSYSDRDRL
jgi:hypothetical protein